MRELRLRVVGKQPKFTQCSSHDLITSQHPTETPSTAILTMVLHHLSVSDGCLLQDYFQSHHQGYFLIKIDLNHKYLVSSGKGECQSPLSSWAVMKELHIISFNDTTIPGPFENPTLEEGSSCFLHKSQDPPLIVK